MGICSALNSGKLMGKICITRGCMDYINRLNGNRVQTFVCAKEHCGFQVFVNKSGEN